MTNFALPSGDDFPAAAAKHLEDARTLHDQSRSDGAAYLSGYVVECALKTLIMVHKYHLTGYMQPAAGHNLNALSAQVLGFISSIGPTRASSIITKYVSRTTDATALRYGTASGEWKETMRYCAAGYVPPATAAIWFTEADRLYIEVIGAMLRDGVITL